MSKVKKTRRRFSFGEEVANSVSHGVMFLCLLFLFPYISVYTNHKGGLALTSTVAIFVVSLLLMFLISCLYHSMEFDTKARRVLNILDHCLIFVAIAGSYTPIALSLIGGWLGVTITVVQWLLVIIGCLYQSLAKEYNVKISLAIYLGMGWTAVFFVWSLIQISNLYFVLFIVLGGLSYTVGIFFYKNYDMKFHHLYWHLAINIASVLHIIAIVIFL